MNAPDYVDVLKALALGRTAEADALMGQHGAASTAEDVYRRNLLSAVFVIVLEQRFQGDHSRAAIDSFIDDCRRAYDGTLFAPLAAEALVRSLLRDEDEDLMDEISPDSYVPTQLALIRKCVKDSAELTARIDDVMTDAKNMVATRDAEDEAE